MLAQASSALGRYRIANTAGLTGDAGETVGHVDADPLRRQMTGFTPTAAAASTIGWSGSR